MEEGGPVVHSLHPIQSRHQGFNSRHPAIHCASSTQRRKEPPRCWRHKKVTMKNWQPTVINEITKKLQDAHL